MATRSVIVRLEAQVGQYVSELNKAAVATERLATVSGTKATAAAQKQKDALQNVGTVAATTGLATVAAVGLSLNAYASFEKQMSSVQAATHETAGNMDLLRQAAVDAGADTAFSAVEAAQGIEELSKAGVSTKDILAGGLSGALDLAAAGALGVGEASELAATAMTQFGLSGEQIPHIADLLAAGAGKAQGSVQDMGAALKQAGLVADQTGLTIEETTGGLAAFASAGLIGSDAGTSFKTMLQRLTPQSEEASKTMEALGLSAYDSQGNFIGLSEYAGKLQSALEDMTDEQRNSTMATLFGSDAVRAAAVLYENGAEGVQKWEDAVNDAGFAAETAAMRQDNLAGDIEKLGGSLDSVFLKSGSGANEFLRGATQNLEGLVDAIGSIPTPILNAGTAIAGVGGAGLVAAGGLATMLPRALETRDALRDLQTSSPRVARGITNIGRAAGAAAGISIFGAALGEVINHFTQDGVDIGAGRIAKSIAEIGREAKAATPQLDTLFTKTDGSDLTTEVNGLDDALTRLFKKDFLRSQVDIFQGIGNALTLGTVKTELEVLGETFEALDAQLASSVSSGKAEDAAKAFGVIEERASTLGIGIDELNTRFPQYTDALAGADAAAISASGSSDGLEGAVTDVGTAAEEATLSIEDYIDSLFNAGMLFLSSRDASFQFEESVRGVTDAVTNAKKAIEEELIAQGHSAESAAYLAEQQYNLGAALNSTRTDFNGNSAAGKVLNDQFMTIAHDGMALVEAKAREGMGQPELQASLAGTYESLLTALHGMGITGDAADTLARKAYSVPDNIDIETWASGAAKAMVDSTDSSVRALDGKTANVYINTHETTYRQIVNERARNIDTSASDKGYSQNAGIGGRATGGRLPTTGPGTERTDGILGVSQFTGAPISWLDGGEWVINAKASEKHNSLLMAINRDDPRIYSIPALSGGGRLSREYAPGASSGGVATLPPINVTAVVENPFTGEQVQAVVRSVAVGVADQRITAASDRASSRRNGMR